MLNNNIVQAFVEANNNIEHIMYVQIVAEHVEHEDLVNKLREFGVDYIQGYVVGRPNQIELSDV